MFHHVREIVYLLGVMLSQKLWVKSIYANKFKLYMHRGPGNVVKQYPRVMKYKSLVGTDITDLFCIECALSCNGSMWLILSQNVWLYYYLFLFIYFVTVEVSFYSAQEVKV